MTTRQNEWDELDDLTARLGKLVVEFTDTAKEIEKLHDDIRQAAHQNQWDELDDLTARGDELVVEFTDTAKEMEKLGDAIHKLTAPPEKAPQTPAAPRR